MNGAVPDLVFPPASTIIKSVVAGFDGGRVFIKCRKPGRTRSKGVLRELWSRFASRLGASSWKEDNYRTLRNKGWQYRAEHETKHTSRHPTPDARWNFRCEVFPGQFPSEAVTQGLMMLGCSSCRAAASADLLPTELETVN